MDGEGAVVEEVGGALDEPQKEEDNNSDAEVIHEDLPLRRYEKSAVK